VVSLAGLASPRGAPSSAGPVGPVALDVADGGPNCGAGALLEVGAEYSKVPWFVGYFYCRSY